MADNFDMKKFLNENKLGPYSKLQENVSLDTTKLKMFIKALVSLGGGKQDKQDYKDIANLLIQNKLADAAEMIRYMDTAPNEMIYSAMMRTYPDLWDTLFDNPPGDYIALAKPKAGLPEEKLKAEGADDLDFKTTIDSKFVKIDGQCYRMDGKLKIKVSHTYCRDINEKKLANEDYAGAEEEKMMDFLAEKEVEEASQGDLMAIERIEEIVNNLARNISTNSNIPTQEKLGLVQALKELKDLVEDLGANVEMEDEYVSDYSRRRASELNEELSPEYIDRMEGLANVQDLAVLKTKLSSLASDWMKEGFEKEDVLEYVEKIIDGSINETKKEPTEEAFGGKNPEGDKLVLRFLQGVSKKFNYPVAHAARFVKDTIKSLGY